MLDESAAALRDNADIVCYIVDLPGNSARRKTPWPASFRAQRCRAWCCSTRRDICDAPDAVVKTFFESHRALASFPHAAVVAKEARTKEIFLRLIEPFIPAGPAYSPRTI